MLLPLQEALARILADAEPLGRERVSLDRADGRVLRQEIAANADLPGFDHSAMDGYALDSRWCQGAGPWSLAVVGESRAGAPWSTPLDQAACRIFTGAPMPPGSDCVLLQENVTREEDTIRFAQRPLAGEHRRLAGADMRQGEHALSAGLRLAPGHLGLLAALDHAFVTVSQRATVTVLSTGDELRLPSTSGPPGSIAESNSFALGSVCRRLGATVRLLPYVADTPEATDAAIEAALSSCDLLVTVGGASKGDHDLVVPALTRCGVHMLFGGVAIKPGKPVAYGRRSSARVLCLPGNPASALVTFSVFGAPLLRRMHAQHPAVAPMQRLPIRGGRSRSTGRTELWRARLELHDGRLHAALLGGQSSGAVTAFAQADALVEVPAELAEVRDGDELSTLRLADAWW